MSWACFPTVNNKRGEPKKPKLETLSAFTRLTPDQNESHDWGGADGIAVALGEPSGGLGCIDVDDPGLWFYLRDRLEGGNHPPLMVQTPNGGHIFTLGPPTLPRDYAAKYPGCNASRYCLVQLLSAGCYAVVPPTEGYRWINPGAEPAYGTTEEVWRRLALALRMPYTRAKNHHFAPRAREPSPRLSPHEIRAIRRQNK
jgi:hypothetical protein